MECAICYLKNVASYECDSEIYDNCNYCGIIMLKRTHKFCNRCSKRYNKCHICGANIKINDLDLYIEKLNEMKNQFIQEYEDIELLYKEAIEKNNLNSYSEDNSLSEPDEDMKYPILMEKYYQEIVNMIKDNKSNFYKKII